MQVPVFLSHTPTPPHSLYVCWPLMPGLRGEGITYIGEEGELPVRDHDM